MRIYDWSSVPEEQVNELATRQIISSETMTVIRRGWKKGAVTGLHRHDDEQISMVESGRVLFVVEGEEQIVTSGQAFVIVSNALHSVEALEDSLVVDVFATPHPE